MYLCWATSLSARDVGKFHIVCLSSWDATYISVGQLHLVLIGFKLKSNNFISLA